MIDHEHKFVYVRVPKTGSSSVMSTLFPELWPKHVSRDTPGSWLYDKSHVPLDMIKDELTSEQYNSYFKFSFVRNPYDRLVSSYFYYNDWFLYHEKHQPYSCFKHFIYALLEDTISLNDRFKYTLQYPYTQGCDYVGRYESLQSDFDHVCEQLNIPVVALPTINKLYPWRRDTPTNQHMYNYHVNNPLQPREHYSCYYDDEILDKITPMLQQDLECFDYSFSDISSSQHK